MLGLREAADDTSLTVEMLTREELFECTRVLLLSDALDGDNVCAVGMLHAKKNGHTRTCAILEAKLAQLRAKRKQTPVSDSFRPSTTPRLTI
jgi:hypothetical protein